MYFLLTIIAGMFYALMSVFIKMALVYSNEPTITFFRFLSASAMLFPMYFFLGRPKLKTGIPFLHVLRGVFGFLMFTFYSMSLEHMPVESVIVLNSTYPLFIPILLFIMFQEKTSMNILFSTLIGFGGVYLIIDPTTSDYMTGAALLAIASAVCSAFSNITIMRLRRTESSFLIIFYFFLLATVLSFIYMISSGPQINSEASLLILGIAFTSLASQQLLSYVLKFLHPNQVSSLMYSSVIFGFLFSWYFWNTMPTASQLIGTIVILLSLLMMRKQKTNRLVEKV